MVHRILRYHQSSGGLPQSSVLGLQGGEDRLNESRIDVHDDSGGDVLQKRQRQGRLSFRDFQPTGCGNSHSWAYESRLNPGLAHRMVHKDSRRRRDGQGQAGRGRNPEHVGGTFEAPNGLQGSHPQPMAIIECAHGTRRRPLFHRPQRVGAAEIGLRKILDRLHSSVRRDQAVRGDA